MGGFVSLRVNVCVWDWDLVNFSFFSLFIFYLILFFNINNVSLRLSTGEGDGAWCPAGAVFPSGSEYLQVRRSGLHSYIWNQYSRCTVCLFFKE